MAPPPPKWPKEAVEELIRARTEEGQKFVRVPENRHKGLWIEISSKLAAKGFKYDADRCRKRFNRLLRTYRGNLGKEPDLRQFEFFSLMEQFQKHVEALTATPLAPPPPPPAVFRRESESNSDDNSSGQGNLRIRKQISKLKEVVKTEMAKSKKRAHGRIKELLSREQQLLEQLRSKDRTINVLQDVLKKQQPPSAANPRLPPVQVSSPPQPIYTGVSLQPQMVASTFQSIETPPGGVMHNASSMMFHPEDLVSVDHPSNNVVEQQREERLHGAGGSCVAGPSRVEVAGTERMYWDSAYGAQSGGVSAEEDQGTCRATEDLAEHYLCLINSSEGTVDLESVLLQK